MKPSVTFIQRKPHPTGNFSLEAIFADIRRRLSPQITARVVEAPYVSEGLWRRIAIAWRARSQAGQVNHVTGDIHYSVLALPRGSAILTIHDCGFLHRTKGLTRAILKVIWLDWPVRRAAVVTTVSQSSRSEIIRETGCPESKVVVVYNSVDERFRPQNKIFDAIRPRILQLGTASNKNVPRLIQALAGLPCHLVIVGKLNDEVRDLLARHKVSYEAFDSLTQAQILEQYGACDIVSFVSTYEGFGMPIVEGNATGRVVITANTGATAEVAGDAACLVNPLDVADIRRGFERVISDENYRSDLIAKGLENRKRFDGERIAQQYLEIYRSLAPKK